jgi:hypothetical protein
MNIFDVNPDDLPPVQAREGRPVNLIIWYLICELVDCLDSGSHYDLALIATLVEELGEPALATAIIENHYVIGRLEPDEEIDSRASVTERRDRLREKLERFKSTKNLNDLDDYEVRILGLAESEREKMGEEKFNKMNFMFFRLECTKWLNEQNVSWADDEESFQQRQTLIERYIAEHPEAQAAIAPYKKKEAGA